MAEIFVFLFLGTSRKIKLYHILYNIDQTNQMRNLPLILISTTIKVLHFVWKHKTSFGCCHFAHVHVLVSNIQFNTKSIERVVAQQFNNHFTANGLHYIVQWSNLNLYWMQVTIFYWFSWYLVFLDFSSYLISPITTSFWNALFVCLYICLVFFVSHDIFSLIWRCYYYRWKTKVWPIRGVNDHRAVRIL